MPDTDYSSESSELPNFHQPIPRGSILEHGQGHYQVKVVEIPAELDPKEDERDKWANSFDFILSAMGYSVGLGNVWRFPYKMHQNGQGAFLIPYFFMVLLVGIPILFLEFVIGQYSAQGPIHVFSNISPVFKVGTSKKTVKLLLKDMF